MLGFSGNITLRRSPIRNSAVRLSSARCTTNTPFWRVPAGGAAGLVSFLSAQPATSEAANSISRMMNAVKGWGENLGMAGIGRTESVAVVVERVIESRHILP